MQGELFLGALALSVFACVAAIALVARDRSKPGAAPLLAGLIAELWWLLFYLGELFAGSRSLMITLAFVQQFGVVVIPLSWTMFVVEYTGRGHHLTRRRLAALAVVPVVTVLGSGISYDGTMLRDVSVMSGGGLSGLTGSFGPLYWVFAVYTWVLVTASAILLIEFVVESRSLYRRRALVLLGAGLVPIGASFVETLDLVDTGIFQLTPLTFAVSAGLASLAVVEFDLFRQAPVPSHLASETALSALEDPTFVIDGERTVVDCNPAALELTGLDRSALLGTVADAVPVLRDADATGSTITAEADGEPVYYDVQRAEVDDDGDHVFGSVVTLRDVTDRRARNEQLRTLSDVLRATIREEMSSVKAAAGEESTDGTDAEALREHAAAALGMSDRAGELVAMVDAEAESPADIVPIIHEEIDTAREWKPDVTFVLEASLGEWAYCNGLFEPVFRVSLRHAARRSLRGDAEPVVGVSVTAGPEAVTVSISDRGPPLTDHERAVLCDGTEPEPADQADMERWLINWGVAQAGGVVRVGTDGDHTSIELTFPRTDSE